jgi:DNA-directed RNA polymerase specialized sigma24 family protein
MGDIYHFSIEDFHNRLDAAKKYLIKEYAVNLLIVAASSVNDGNKAELIVNDAFQEVFKHADQFHSQGAIREFLYNKVKEECDKFNS